MQYIPQIDPLQIDWLAVSQLAIDDVAIVLPGLLSGTQGGRLNKRDLNNEIIQIIDIITIPDRTTALLKFQEYLRQAFSQDHDRLNLDIQARNLFDQLDNLK